MITKTSAYLKMCNIARVLSLMEAERERDEFGNEYPQTAIIFAFPVVFSIHGFQPVLF